MKLVVSGRKDFGLIYTYHCLAIQYNFIHISVTYPFGMNSNYCLSVFSSSCLQHGINFVIHFGNKMQRTRLVYAEAMICQIDL
jgi:hypothetical protein